MSCHRHSNGYTRIIDHARLFGRDSDIPQCRPTAGNSKGDRQTGSSNISGLGWDITEIPTAVSTYSIRPNSPQETLYSAKYQPMTRNRNVNHQTRISHVRELWLRVIEIPENASIFRNANGTKHNYSISRDIHGLKERDMASGKSEAAITPVWSIRRRNSTFLCMSRAMSCTCGGTRWNFRDISFKSWDITHLNTTIIIRNT
jgi:hypothetical protein